jgi:hypothetical protein
LLLLLLLLLLLQVTTASRKSQYVSYCEMEQWLEVRPHGWL